MLILAYRSELQKAFFPPTYQNAEESPHLKPGDKRVWTAMQVFIELRDDTTLHIPFREASKVIFLAVEPDIFLVGLSELAMGWTDKCSTTTQETRTCFDPCDGRGSIFYQLHRANGGKRSRLRVRC
jgi:hypothetical protein